MKKDRAVGFLGVALLFLAAVSFAPQSAWGKFPEKPITMIMCWSAGGQIDITARALATPASKILGQQIIVDTRPGGSGGVGMGYLKSRKADGYTIAVTTISTQIHQHMNKVPYDVLRDFTPVMQYSDAAYCIAVLASSPWKSVKDLIDYAKANPGKIRISSSGPGDPGGFLVMSALAERYQLDWKHIPFEGGVPGVAALLGGHVEVFSGALGNPAAHIKAGKLRLLATLGDKRSEQFPDAPTLKEMGIPIVAPSYSAIFAPKGLPADILEILHQGLRKAMDDPDFKKSLQVTDKGWVYRSPQDFAKDLLEVDQMIGRTVNKMKEKK